MKFVEELGMLFRNDPTFSYVFSLPKSHMMKVVELRRKRIEAEQLPGLPSLS